MKQVNVILIAHYDFDEQESMRRYSGQLNEVLSAGGFQVHPIKPKAFFGKLKPGSTGISKWLGYIDKYVLFPISLKRVIARLKKDGGEVVVSLPDHSHGIYLHWISREKHVVHCHDMMAIRAAVEGIVGVSVGWSGRIYQKLILGGLRRARVIVSVSEKTAEDFERHVGIRSGVKSQIIYNFLNYRHTPLNADEIKERLSQIRGIEVLKDRPYILHVGGNQWYKNRIGVIEIYVEFLQRHPESELVMVMVGKAPTMELRKMAELQEGRVIFLTEVDDSGLNALYSGAKCFLFPSIMEGFGWPIIEAQSARCPVITSDRKPMNEVGTKGSALLIKDTKDSNMLSIESAVECIERVCEWSDVDRQMRLNLAAKNLERFSKTYLAAQHCEVYQATSLV